jgi:uncharacterized protein
MAIQKRLLDCVAALAMTLVLLLATPASAQTFPKLTGRVVDEAHLLTPAQVVDLTSKSQALEAATGRQFVVATVPDLQGYPIEDYGYRLGRSWAIGQKGQNNGVILLVAPKEHKVRIEVGYGAGIFLTDAVSGDIIRNTILPRFKAGDMGGGIEAGADRIINQMTLSPEEARKNAAQAEQAQRQRQVTGIVLPGAFWLMIVAFLLLGMFRRSSGRRYRYRHGGINPWVVLWGLNELSRASRGRSGWGGSSWDSGGSWSGGGGWGGGGGGGFSGGGGSFGGGGASGSW